MVSAFDLSKPDRTIRAGVILMNAETEVLDVAPIDLLHAMSNKFLADIRPMIPADLKGDALDIDFYWVNEKGGQAKLTGGINMQPTNSFADCPPLDIVVMGAHKQGYEPNEAELAFVRKAYHDCAAFITICAGFQPACAAGLFKGKTVTCPRFMLGHMRQAAPEATWVEERWHHDGKLWTSGALLSGVDLMRAFGTHFWGGEGTLMEWALDAGQYPRRDVNYADAPNDI